MRGIRCGIPLPVLCRRTTDRPSTQTPRVNKTKVRKPGNPPTDLAVTLNAIALMVDGGLTGAPFWAPVHRG
jgi:hypothetical protein